jgi:CubicO group peptidase (beta-lactamase class C family)
MPRAWLTWQNWLMFPLPASPLLRVRVREQRWSGFRASASRNSISAWAVQHPNEMSDAIAEKMQQGLDEGVFPGAVLLVASRNEIIHHASYGFATLIPQSEPTSVDTCYDLASLTKPLATVTATLMLAAAGRIDLEAPLAQFLPELPKESLRRGTIRQLLNHCTGLPAWRPFYERIVPDGTRLREMPLAQRRSALYDAIHHEQLIEPVGARSTYSDLGFILLGELLERVSGKDWGSLIHDQVFARLEIAGLFYMSEAGPTGAISIRDRRFAATELDPWRGRLLRGEVHDEHAAVMGGISSHAGLFGTAQGVFEMAALWLAAVRGEDSLLPTNWAREFVRRQNLAPGSSWALGWDTPSRGPAGETSSSGNHFSSLSFGHLGYAGTSVWIDPERCLIVVLLTNRVHPSRTNNLIRQFRPVLHDTVVMALKG